MDLMTLIVIYSFCILCILVCILAVRKFCLLSINEYNKIPIIIIKFFIILYVLGCLFIIIIPSMLDFPLVLKGDYEHTIAMATEDYNFANHYWIELQKKDGTQLKICVFGTYTEGKIYDVYYLPHLKWGTLYPIFNDEF